jgi:hypothetical protein
MRSTQDNHYDKPTDSLLKYGDDLYDFLRITTTRCENALPLMTFTILDKRETAMCHDFEVSS